MGSFYESSSTWQTTTQVNTPVSVPTTSNRAVLPLSLNRRSYDQMEGEATTEPPPRMPDGVKELMIRQLAGSHREISDGILVIQKELTETDVNSHHNRLSIPIMQLKAEFLTYEEKELLCKRNGKKVCSMDDVPFITPMMEAEKVSLRRWEMKKERGGSSVSYVIAKTWNKIRGKNKLRGKMTIQLWAIRVDGNLWLALVKLPHI